MALQPPLLWLFPILFIGLSTSAVAQTTDEEEPAVPALLPLPTILRAIKEPTPAHMRQADQVWQQQQAALGADMLTRYAMALAMVSNNRHASAFTLMESTPEVARKAGPLRRLWIWLAVKTKKDDIASHELHKLIIEFGTRATATPPANNDLEDLQFAAKLVAYLELIAERELPLDSAQAKTWWTKLEMLPEAWHQQLPTLRTSLLVEKEKLEQQLQMSHAAWHAKTIQELNEVNERIADFEPKEKDAQQKLEVIAAQYQNFLKSAEPQMQSLKQQAASAQATLRSLFPPVEPARPTRDSKGLLPAGAERNYERSMEAYRNNLQQYRNSISRANSALASANQQAAVLTRQDNNFQRTVAQANAQLKKIQNPRETAVKTQDRLTKSLAEFPTWDSSASLAKLRTIEAYRILSLTAEAERIERKRG